MRAGAGSLGPVSGQAEGTRLVEQQSQATYASGTKGARGNLFLEAGETKPAAIALIITNIHCGSMFMPFT